MNTYVKVFFQILNIIFLVNFLISEHDENTFYLVDQIDKNNIFLSFRKKYYNKLKCCNAIFFIFFLYYFNNSMTDFIMNVKIIFSL